MNGHVLRLVLLCAIAVSTAANLFAQNYKLPYGDEVSYSSLIITSPDKRQVTDLKGFLDIGRGTNVTKLALFVGGYQTLIDTAEQARLDKQAGSGSSSEGTTSIVSKGVAPQILSLGVEQGALTRTDNQSIATFRGNAVGIARLLAGEQAFPYCAIFDYRCESGIARVIRGSSFSVSFDASRNSSLGSSTSSISNAQGSVLTASARQLSGWSIRYDFHVRRRDLSKDYLAQWQTTITNGTAVSNDTAYLKAVEAFVGDLRNSGEYHAWLTKYTQLLGSNDAGGENNLKKVLSQAVAELATIGKKEVPDFAAKAKALLTALGTYMGARDKALAEVINRVTYSLEYDNDRPLGQPNQSSAKFILSGRFGSSEQAQVTLNGTATWYDQSSPASAVRRFRDAQVAIQFDRTMTRQSSSVGAAITAGYYFQYMVDNGLLSIPSSQLAPGTSIPLPGNASVLLGTKGSIHLGECGVTFTVPGTGIKVPLAITFSNRTELIKASTVTGHFGITYDFDSLFSKK